MAKALRKNTVELQKTIKIVVAAKSSNTDRHHIRR